MLTPERANGAGMSAISWSNGLACGKWGKTRGNVKSGETPVGAPLRTRRKKAPMSSWFRLNTSHWPYGLMEG